MKRVFRFFILFLLAGLLLLTAGFLALALYYRNNFPVNTWINGVYCTGKTVEQINEELRNEQEVSAISIVDADGIYWELDMREAGIWPDYTEQLDSYLRKNASIFWTENLGSKVSQEIAPESYVLTEETFRKAFEELSFVKSEARRGKGVRVRYSEDGYYLQDDNSHRLNPDKAVSAVKESLGRGETTVFLLESGCYEDIPDSREDQEQRALWMQLCDFTQRSGRIVYDMGSEKIAFTPDISGGFLKKEAGRDCPALDSKGNLVIEEERVLEWVEQLKEAYDTCSREREFQSTRGDVITVAYETYGTELDGEAEQAYLLEALKWAVSGEVTEGLEIYGPEDTESESDAILHVPSYRQQGFVRGLDDIGDTYIEIDMTEQKMYYYVDGELTLETDVVTGDTGKRRGTPVGIYYVYNMERNRTLRGTGYTSFVKYWMPINGGVGIHDASWRRSFGGEIYKTDGSHGCINTPMDVMAQLYESAEIGTPAIVFY